jgi:hypothetical protein
MGPGRKKEFSSWEQKFPADQGSIFVLNLRVHKHAFCVLADLGLNSRNNVCHAHSETWVSRFPSNFQ